MLKLKSIRKEYKTGDFVQRALDGVSLTLRDNEFVAVLGPSGSGKTTLLNIIGGLDRYDAGDLIIGDVSTKKYRDGDWDSYRNHSVGFVFQSYNLIPHQSVLSNVELALTISGIPKRERRARARRALERVGLSEHVHKKPNQLSGGQMQRVAIARALINDPDILLADEPTGALDSETSKQVMELLSEVASDRLVVMVTHNPELAERYATRTVTLQDGRITSDTNPVEEQAERATVHRNFGRARMSFLTALSLSFKNLLTKKARTFLTSFAGSIGIIGISLILSLSNGVNNYINDIQKETMSSYPVSINAQTMDLSSVFQFGQTAVLEQSEDHEDGKIYANTDGFEVVSAAATSITENNLTRFKEYLENKDSEIHEFLGENGVVYSYDTDFSVFTYDPEGALVNTDGSTLTQKQNLTGAMVGGMSQMTSNMTSAMSGSMSASPMGSMMGGSNFEQLLPRADGTGISDTIKDNYTLLTGQWPTSYDEVVLVVNANRELSAQTLYELGLLPTSEYRALIEKIEAGETLEFDEQSLSFDDVLGQKLYLLAACDFYEQGEDGLFSDISSDTARLEARLEDALSLTVSAIVCPSGDQSFLSAPFGYTAALTDYLITYTEESDVVQAQMDSPDTNVLSGLRFTPKTDAEKADDAKEYLAALSISEKARFFDAFLSSMPADPAQAQGMAALGEVQKAAMLDAYLADPKEEELLSIYDTYISPGDYDDNLSAFGLVSFDAPSAIHLYADSFEDKDGISESIRHYNESADELDQIVYTDYVGLLMGSMTTIIDVISYVLIAFVAVSLVVSSIMIGIITYISVLERTKEIGILRAIGASKRNISQVFNAETFIIGLFAGLIGVGATVLLNLPINALIHHLSGIDTIHSALPPVAAAILVLLSLILTIISGLIPAKKAAKKDPVIALRTE